MKTLSNKLSEAAGDYLFLLNRHYPQSTLIKLVGDRYQLSGTERSMLYRGIFATNEAIARKNKLAGRTAILGQTLTVDACNVLITIGSYLNGNVVFISNDQFLRDASEIHGKVFRSDLIERSLSLLIEFLKVQQPGEIRFLIDTPVSYSGQLAARINQMLPENNLKGSAETHPSPDFILKTLESGIIATSDSAIIDKTPLPVYDLPYQVLTHHFTPDFFDLGGII